MAIVERKFAQGQVNFRYPAIKRVCIPCINGILGLIGVKLWLPCWYKIYATSKGVCYFCYYYYCIRLFNYYKQTLDTIPAKLIQRLLQFPPSQSTDFSLNWNNTTNAVQYYNLLYKTGWVFFFHFEIIFNVNQWWFYVLDLPSSEFRLWNIIRLGHLGLKWCVTSISLILIKN